MAIRFAIGVSVAVGVGQSLSLFRSNYVASYGGKTPAEGARNYDNVLLSADLSGHLSSYNGDPNRKS